MIMRAAIEHMAGSIVCDSDNRIVGRRLLVIAISRALRHTIETTAGDDVRTTG
jgi:hypothetical protein